MGFQHDAPMRTHVLHMHVMHMHVIHMHVMHMHMRTRAECCSYTDMPAYACLCTCTRRAKWSANAQQHGTCAHTSTTRRAGKSA